MSEKAYIVYGLMPSYFTRKMTGYLDYKSLPWRLAGSSGAQPGAVEAGWTGGMPSVETPEGEFMWDTSSMISYLEGLYPEPSVLPDDPAQRFLCYLIEDYMDEWLYRPAVGSRWCYEDNYRVAAWEIARGLSMQASLPCDQIVELAGAHVRRSLVPIGVTEDNIGSWIDEVLRPWQRAAGRLLDERPYFFGARPSLADLAAFGGNVAHFINEPLCRRWTEEDAPAVVEHTHRLAEPEGREFGDWAAGDEVSDALVGLIADAGRLYLPWVARACRDGEAELVFDSGEKVLIRSTEFLKEARRTLLARYLEHRSSELDAILERAGVLGYFVEFTDGAGEVAVFDGPPRPALNRPFPPDWEA